MYRGDKPKVEEKEWLKKFKSLNKSEKDELIKLLCENRTSAKLKAVKFQTNNSKLIDILEYYSLPTTSNKSLSLFD